mgnify:CR=1 FL=1|jgi:hypothetical protein
MIKTEENPDFSRDEKSKAIINTNIDAYHAFINKRKQKKKLEEKVEYLMNEVAALKNIINNLINE